MTRTTRITRGQALTIVIAGGIISLLLWNVSFLSPLAYPFRLFVTYVHEAGHGIAAVISGGEIIQFTVSPNGAGLATTAGGSRALILPAGYLGAALFGTVLFVIINRRPSFARWISIALGVGLIVFTVLYARPDISGAPTAILVGLAFGAALIAAGWKASPTINLLVLSVLAIMTALQAVLDLTTLVGYADACTRIGGQRICNDAQAFHDQVASFLPATVWAFLWAGIAMLMSGVSVYFSLVRPWLNSSDDTPEGSPATPTPKRRRDRNESLKDLPRTDDGDIDWSNL